jgi:predicted RNA methylase
MNNVQERPNVLGQYIPLHYHTNMLRDGNRMMGFKEALEKVVPENAKVLDLGGGTGVLSFFAAGKAAKVWCVENNPELVKAARQFLPLNPNGNKIEVVHADAMEYLPPEPVDVVICEMVHVAMLREKQIQIINSFKVRYQQKFGKGLPIFVPEAAIMAVQPVQQSFHFAGFYAPTPIFFDPGFPNEETKGLGNPFQYQMFLYNQEIPEEFNWDGSLVITTEGTVNALRFITKNNLAILVKENRAIEWFSHYLVVPIPQPIKVQKDDRIRIRFSYPAGATLSALTDSIQISKG